MQNRFNEREIKKLELTFLSLNNDNVIARIDFTIDKNPKMQPEVYFFRQNKNWFKSSFIF